MAKQTNIQAGMKWTDSMGHDYEVTSCYRITGGLHCHLKVNGKPITDLHGGKELIPLDHIERLRGGRDTAMIEQYVTHRAKTMKEALKQNQQRLGTIYIAR